MSISAFKYANPTTAGFALSKGEEKEERRICYGMQIDK